MFSMILYVISMGCAGFSILLAGAVASCYQDSRRMSKWALMFSVGAWVLSFLAWVVFATLVAGNHRCAMGAKGANYILSIVGSFFQFFASILIAVHWGSLIRRERKGGYASAGPGSAMPVPANTSGAPTSAAVPADSGYSPMPASDNPFTAPKRGGGYGTTVSDSPFD